MAAGALLVATATWSAPAGAHGDLEQASPGPGDSVAPGTAVLGLTFSQVNRRGGHYLALLDAEERPLPVGAAVAVSASTVCAASAPLREGVHTLEYSVSDDDGHPITGRYTFEVVAGGDATTPGACAEADLPEPGQAQTLEEMTADGVGGWLLAGVAAAVVLSGLLVLRRLLADSRHG